MSLSLSSPIALFALNAYTGLCRHMHVYAVDSVTALCVLHLAPLGSSCVLHLAPLALSAYSMAPMVVLRALLAPLVSFLEYGHIDMNDNLCPTVS